LNRLIETESPPMPRPTTPDHLLDTAERLYAERGLDAVSLRTINAEAGVNPAAVHYHFGSREALIEALLVRRMGPVMARRAARLEALASARATSDARAVVEALVLPLAELLGEAGPAARRYLAFLARLLDARAPELEAVVRRHFRAGTERIEPLLARALPHVPTPVLHARLRLAAELAGRGLAQPIAPGALMDFIAGGLAAAVTEEPRT
jgi:AcrR family transcriptional regulator